MRSEPTRQRHLTSSPIDPAQAARDLEQAADREQIFALLLRAARHRAPFVALLSVHKEMLCGRRAIADDRFDASAVPVLRIPRGAIPAFEEAISTGFPVIGPIATGEPTMDELLAHLGGVVPPAAMVLPIVLEDRTVALLVVHRGDVPVAADEGSELFPLLSASSRVLQRVLAPRAEAAAQKPGRRAQTSTPVPGEPVVDEVTALRRVLAIYRQYESWEELADALRGLIRVGVERGDPDEDEQLELLLELGGVELDHLERPELAIEAWRSAQTIDATDPRVIAALEKVFVAEARWEDFVELLERRAALTDDLPERVGLMLNVAAFSLERLGDEERATEAYERILKWEPTHEGAAEKLEGLYRARGMWQPLADLLLEQASRVDDPRARVAALESAAETFEERTGDPRAAFLVWLTVLRREPDRADLVNVLERLGQAAGAWGELLPACEDLAAELEEEHVPVAARLWRQIGRWKRDHAGLRAEAAAALDRSLRLDRDDVETLDELIALSRETGSWPELATALARRAELEADEGPRAERFHELGEVHEAKLGRAEEARAAYEKALLANPAHRGALGALRRLHRDGEAWDDLARVLGQSLEALAGGEARAEVVELHLELGVVLEHLGRREEAAQAFKNALDLDPQHPAAYQGLQEIYKKTGEREAYLENLEAEVDAGASPEEAHRYLEVASGWEERGRFDRAAAAWQKLLAHDGRHEEAHRGRVRSLREASSWEALAGALRAELRIIAAGPERSALLLELASVSEARLGDLDGAARAAEEALALGVNPGACLELLARVHEQSGRWNDALAALERLASEAKETPRRAELQQRMGTIHAARGDAAHALASFETALRLDPTSAAAHDGLAEVARGQGDWEKTAHHLLRAAQLHQERPAIIRCLGDAAAVYREKLGDAERARACLQKVLEHDPEHAEAKALLGELLQAAGQWEALWPHLEARARTLAADPTAAAEERLKAFTEAARCGVHVRRFEEAIAFYDLALKVDPAKIALLVERADALLQSQAWETAARAYQSILVHHAGGLSREESAGIYRKLAHIQQQLGRGPQAMAFYQKALEVEPGHRATLEELTELQLASGRFDEAIAGLRALAEAVPSEKPALLERIGDLQRDKMQNPGRAASIYLDVVELDPTNHRVLQKLLDLQTETGQWKAALETIARFAALEKDPPRRGKYHVASATIRRFKLRDDDGALVEYDKALDDFFSAPHDPATRTRALEAFQGIDEILTAHKDWAHQERAYRAMIKRVSAGDPVLVPLWHALGEIHRSRLKQPETAIAAFETAHALDPEKSPDRVKILAELYRVAGKQAPAEVTDRAARLVESDPGNPDAYRALGRACLEAGKLDEAWCVCRALVFLKQATPEEEALYRKHETHERKKSKNTFDEDSWSLLRDDDEDRAITSIFSLVWEGPVALRAGPTRSFELNPKERLQVEGDTRVMSKIFQNSARVLNAPLPHVYVQPNRSGRLLLANCVENGRLHPTLIVGRDLMAGYRDTEIAFAVASTLALLRPAYYLRLALPSADELEAALVAAARLGGANPSVRPELAPFLETLLPEIQKRLTPQGAEVLTGLVKRLRDKPDLLAWMNAVDAAARRAGLLVCGELAAAARMASSEPAHPGGPRPADKVKELVVYSVSPAYFAARRHLGVTVA